MRVVILGSTGSIGVQALDVVSRLGGSVAALTADRNVRLLEEQVRAFSVPLCALADEAAAADLRVRLADTPAKVLSGPEGVACCARTADPDPADPLRVLNSIVGVAGLSPTLAALETGHTVALANKESLVAGGELVVRAAAEHGASLLPVDSEHSAIFQALQGCPDLRSLRGVILTASGGPFFGKSRAELADVTISQALAHPTWSMGAKITVDSATMMNKGLELMEAAWLFGLPPERIDVVVHRQSIVHSLIEYHDGAVLAQLGLPDMRVPIQYALTYPQRLPSPAGRLNLAEWGTLTFEAPDEDAFPAPALCREALRRGGVVPAAVNAANEEANALFRAGKLRFPQITEAVACALDAAPAAPADSLGAVLSAGEWARELVRAHYVR
ncbi:MAG: 1-deoxy-D-xylulose-5-phosphate reductoisomerase [Oscillospiraceae bacterium]|jgi:1-deoxy-D-xylulose-5-phosphate reductoisomerase|nr:1-deoxy-D-xylulose-5-phosphate reductoisomerase [Oscillospiraceae bacterium]